MPDIDPVSQKVYLAAAETEPGETTTQEPAPRLRLTPGTFALITASQ